MEKHIKHTEPRTVAENYNDSLKKCKQISDLIPALADNIKRLKSVDDKFKINYDLELSDQLLQSLENMEAHMDESNKEEYVNAYRDNLETALFSLSDFLSDARQFQGLNPHQRQTMVQIAASLSVNQKAIERIAKH